MRGVLLHKTFLVELQVVLCELRTLCAPKTLDSVDEFHVASFLGNTITLPTTLPLKLFLFPFYGLIVRERVTKGCVRLFADRGPGKIHSVAGLEGEGVSMETKPLSDSRSVSPRKEYR